ncbi:MAG: PfkB family carbohydrate kinase [bacterium]|nr:PfkB family carbohydrate kinase [bacterium]
MLKHTRISDRKNSVAGNHAKTYLDQLKAKFNSAKVIKTLQTLRGLRVLVVGDAVIDEYTFCRRLGMATKDPIVNCQFVSTDVFAGGVCAIANHVAGFTGVVRMITVVGNDGRFKRVQHLLDSAIDCRLVVKGTSTTVKQRFIELDTSTKMFELTHMDDSPISGVTEKKLLAVLAKDIAWADMVLLADFGHGMITPSVINFLSKSGKFLAVNAQTNSANTPYNPVTKHKSMHYLSLDEKELRLAFHSRYDPPEELLPRLASATGCKAINLTLGSNGAIYWHEGKPMSVPAFMPSSVLDSTGAGDAVLSVTSLLAYKGVSPELLPFVGNCVGALAVGILGNKEPVRPQALYDFITDLLSK